MEFELVERPVAAERAGDARILREQREVFRWSDVYSAMEAEADANLDDQDHDKALHIPEEEHFEPED